MKQIGVVTTLTGERIIHSHGLHGYVPESLLRRYPGTLDLPVLISTFNQQFVWHPPPQG